MPFATNECMCFASNYLGQQCTCVPRSSVKGLPRPFSILAELFHTPSLLQLLPLHADTLHRFCKKEHDWGWKKFMELSKVLEGFTVANTLVIKAQVQVIRYATWISMHAWHGWSQALSNRSHCKRAYCSMRHAIQPGQLQKLSDRVWHSMLQHE